MNANAKETKQGKQHICLTSFPNAILYFSCNFYGKLKQLVNHFKGSVKGNLMLLFGNHSLVLCESKKLATCPGMLMVLFPHHCIGCSGFTFPYILQVF